LIEIVKLLTPANTMAVFGRTNPTQKQIAQASQFDMRRHTPRRRLVSEPDSDILKRILAG
jgi:hypothetical protein